MTKLSMWASFWGKHGSKRAELFHITKRSQLLDRSVRPLFEIHCARWPAQTTYGHKLDALQKKMIGIMLGRQRQPGETQRMFASRVSLEVQPHIGKSWSKVWWLCMKTRVAVLVSAVLRRCLLHGRPVMFKN